MDKLVSNTNPNLLQKAVKRISDPATHTSIPVDKALALFLDMDLSFRQYELMRTVANAAHKQCFPSYYALQNAKKKYIPDSVLVSETSVEIQLQNFLNMTAKSYLDLYNIKSKDDLICDIKWGFDGSSGHSNYKQKFNDPDSNDEFLFIVSFVPLRFLNWGSEAVVWNNIKHSSTKHCRPIRFYLQKENASLIKSVKDSIQTEIDRLETYTYVSGDTSFNVHFNMHLTMIDGAVLNVLTGNKSSSSCFACGAKPSEMNSVDVLKRNVKSEEFYKYGLSTLHAWIKFFECVLHISYRLPLRIWKVCKPDDKNIVSERKYKIQAQFKEEMGLLVDKVKTGYGTSNDGNTARRFFNNIEMSSKITEIDPTLIRNFSYILKTLSSGDEINVNNFDQLLRDTWYLYIENYAWYYMPATVHKILVHGVEFIKHSKIPVGMLSEEAIEATHKVFRKTRLNHTRKNSRESTNKDLIERMILQSEPNITIHRKANNKKAKNYNDIKQFLIQSESHTEECSETIIAENLLTQYESSDTDYDSFSE